MRITHYRECLNDAVLVLKANDGVVCRREAPLGPYKDAIALRPIEDSDAPDFYEKLLECSLVISEVTEETPPNEADQIRDFESNLEDILQERRADWRLTEVSILQSCMLLEYKSTTRLGSQFLQIDYDGGLEVRFRMAPTVFGHPATYDLKVTERTPGENGESRWFVCLTEDLHYVHRSIWFDGEGEDGRISLDVTECCGY